MLAIFVHLTRVRARLFLFYVVKPEPEFDLNPTYLVNFSSQQKPEVWSQAWPKPAIIRPDPPLHLTTFYEKQLAIFYTAMSWCLVKNAIFGVDFLPKWPQLIGRTGSPDWWGQAHEPGRFDNVDSALAQSCHVDVQTGDLKMSTAKCRPNSELHTITDQEPTLRTWAATPVL
jgi:hypothetical protein